MIYQIIKYFEFLIKSTSKHGVHSPFVFDLVTNCFNKKTQKRKLKIFSNYQLFLKNNKDNIKVTDFGAGSRVFKTNERLVSDILKHVTVSKKQGAFLIRLVEYFNFKNILEIGTSLGVGTLTFALGNEKATITTLEGCPNTIKIPKENLYKFTSNSINFIEGQFSKTLTEVVNKNTFDLVYFDGNHQKQATIDYFEMCLQSIHNNTVFIFDDIYWSKEMTEAWEFIKNHPKVKLTIDTYNLGFVFFREEQYQKEHFVIRM